MREHVRNGLVLAASLMLALPASGWARHSSPGDDTSLSQDQSQSSTDAYANPVAATGWGMGFGYLPTTYGSVDTLSLTYRPAPYWDVDVKLMDGGLSVPEGTNSQGGVANDTENTLGVGAQARYAVLRPSRYLSFQAVGGLSYTNISASDINEGNTANDSLGLFNIFLGVGFEGFIPCWPAISVEANSGFNIGLGSISNGGSNHGYNSFSFGENNVSALEIIGLPTSSFVPFNLAVHYYFD